MSQRGSMGWSGWEENTLLSWLDAQRALPWKIRPDADFEQFQIHRTVESL